MDHRLWVLTGLTFKFRAWLRNLSLTLPIVSGSLKYYCLSHQWAGVMVHFSLRNLASKQTEKKRTTTNNTGTKWLQPSKNYNRRGGDQRNCETGIHCWINKKKKKNYFIWVCLFFLLQILVFCFRLDSLLLDILLLSACLCVQLSVTRACFGEFGTMIFNNWTNVNLCIRTQTHTI